MNNIFRTPEQQASYESYKAAGGLSEGCALCQKESLRDFDRWRTIVNIFPYDKIAEEHHMIIPKRHVVEAELSEEEVKELADIKREYIEKNYDFTIEAMPKMKSIPQHFHVHLIVAKK